MPTTKNEGNCGPSKRTRLAQKWLDNVWNQPINSRDFQINPNKNINKTYTFDKRHTWIKNVTEKSKVQEWLPRCQKIYIKRKQVGHINIRQKVSRQLTLWEKALKKLNSIKLYKLTIRSIRKRMIRKVHYVSELVSTKLRVFKKISKWVYITSHPLLFNNHSGLPSF